MKSVRRQRSRLLACLILGSGICGDLVARQPTPPTQTGVSEIGQSPSVGWRLAVDFGSAGLWERRGNGSWFQLHTFDASLIASGDIDGDRNADLIADFTGFGVWAWMNGTSWVQIHPLDATRISVGDLDGNKRDDVVLSFSGHGVYAYMNNADWVRLHSLNPSLMSVGDTDGDGKSDLVAAFPGYGVWAWKNNAAWVGIHGLDVTSIAVGDLDGAGGAEILLAFPSYGLYMLRDGSWTRLHSLTPTRMTIGDIDGNGQGDGIVDFTGFGVYGFKNLSSWVHLHPLNPEIVQVASDVARFGQADVLMSFPGLGLFGWLNDASFEQLHVAPPEGLAILFDASLAETSYRNFKRAGLVPQALPAGVEWNTTRTFTDFFGSGRLDLFTAFLTYSPGNPIANATPSRFEFWRKQANGSYVKDTVALSSNAGCIHPRKAIVADFNNDRRPDVFVACHGYDALPFPGERNKVVLSQPNGTYSVHDASNDVGFFHGASAADLNGDGHVDVVVVNNFDPATVFVLLNQGNGTFVREAAGRLPSSLGWKQYFTVELVDIDEDGRLDLILGGHEWENGSSTAVLLNPGNNDFSAVQPVALPPVSGEGVVLDFTLTGTGSSRSIWIVRTSGGDGTFYQSRVVQKVRWPSLTSSIVLTQRPGPWFPWLIPAVVNGQSVVASDDAGAGVLVSAGAGQD